MHILMIQISGFKTLQPKMQTPTTLRYETQPLSRVRARRGGGDGARSCQKLALFELSSAGLYLVVVQEGLALHELVVLAEAVVEQVADAGVVCQHEPAHTMR